jgi:YfiH family protein
MAFVPELRAVFHNGVGFLIDEGARDAGVLVAFGNRRGGVSRPPYDELNLALRVGDDRDDVIENRRRAAAGARFDSASLALARQVHGSEVIEVSPGQTGVLGVADVLVARSPGPVLGVLTADCAPVVMAGDRGVAIVHAGWRGLVAGAVEKGIDEVGPVWAAWVGPSVHDCCYEVGPDVIEAFADRHLPTGRGHVDPAGAAAHVLRRSGVEAVSVAAECTHCDPAYFSFRRQGITGRQGAFAGLLRHGAKGFS